MTDGPGEGDCCIRLSRKLLRPTTRIFCPVFQSRFFPRSLERRSDVEMGQQGSGLIGAFYFLENMMSWFNIDFKTWESDRGVFVIFYLQKIVCKFTDMV